MTKNKNFLWLEEDIDSTLILKVLSKKNGKEEESKVFNIVDVLETTGDKLEIETANIDDLTNLLTLGIVRFVNILDSSDVLDIPLRNLYKLYENAKVLEENLEGRLTSFKELDVFSVIDEEIRDDLFINSSVVGLVSNDLKKVMVIASKFGSYGMQEKFDAMTEITMINHRRLVSDAKNRGLK